LFIFYFLSLNTYDYSIDGRTYHQAGILFLSQGWNPIYHNIDTFVYHLYPTSFEGTIWVENYPKFAETVQANILAFTGKIEISKILNWLSCFIVFGYSFYILNKNYFEKISPFAKLLISLALTLNPVVVGQICTLFIDNLVYLYFMLLLLSITDIETQETQSKKTFLFMIMSSVCLINIKLSGIVYAIITLTVYLIYILWQKQKSKLKLLFLSLLIILSLSIMAGINPYYTNIYKDRHPLYPLAGEGKIDVVTHCIPSSFSDKNPLERFFLSTFSEVSNFTYEIKDQQHKLKIPFTAHKKEIFDIAGPDIRICGFGIFWSGILLLSLFLAVFIRYNNKNEKKLGLLLFSILILLSINPYSWWARYTPHLWALPVYIILFLLLGKQINTPKKILSYFILIIMLVNITIPAIFIGKLEKNYKTDLNRSIKYLKERNKKIKIYHISEWSIIQKLKENNIEIEFIDDDYYYKHENEFETMDLHFFENMLWDVKRGKND